jgi:glycine betaine/proline transport system permease protein
MDNFLPKLPVSEWIDIFVTWLTDNLEPFFDGVTNSLEFIVEGMVTGMTFIPSYVFMILLALLAWKISNKRMALFTLVGLFLIDNLRLWDAMLDTLALVLAAVFISILVGIPLGIWASQKRTVKQVVIPFLDFMQTMPAFVYLIPAIFFFNIGVVPGVVSSVIFSMPPTIRLTMLGIQQVPADIIEATESFGSTTGQRLIKVQIPLAMPTIMAGINQSIMLALSMVVISSMVGAPGLGADVYRAVTQIQIGKGFEAGIAIVIIAIVLDRLTQKIGNKKQRGTI